MNQDFLFYALPDGTYIRVAYDLCKGASYITYTLKGGKVVMAVIAEGQR